MKMNNWRITTFYALALVAFAYGFAWLVNAEFEHMMIWMIFGAHLAHIDGKYAHVENIARELSK